MKIFFYKVLLVFIFFILSIHFSFGILKKQIKSELINLTSKEKIESIKNQIRDELKNGLNKQVLINPDDAKIINSFINKIKRDLQTNKGN